LSNQEQEEEVKQFWKKHEPITPPCCKGTIPVKKPIRTGIYECHCKKFFTINWVNDKTKEIGAYEFDNSKRDPDWYELANDYLYKVHKQNAYSQKIVPLLRNMEKEQLKLQDERIRLQVRREQAEQQREGT
jgi:hypothetical protein